MGSTSHTVTHGVASGDPFSTSVLLWTRAAPSSSSQPPDQSVPICVSFSIFSNQELKGKPVDSCEAFTSYDVDWTVKLEATGLKPDTVYWYRFADCSNSDSISDTGRTRTLASPDSKCLVCHKIVPFTLNPRPLGAAFSIISRSSCKPSQRWKAAHFCSILVLELPVWILQRLCLRVAQHVCGCLCSFGRLRE